MVEKKVYVKSAATGSKVLKKPGSAAYEKHLKAWRKLHPKSASKSKKRTCKSGYQIYKTSTGRFVCIPNKHKSCGKLGRYKSGYCKCKAGYGRLFGRGRCTKLKSRASKKRTCKPGLKLFTTSAGKIVCIPTRHTKCPRGIHRYKTGYCMCKKNYYRRFGRGKCLKRKTPVKKRKSVSKKKVYVKSAATGNKILKKPGSAAYEKHLKAWRKARK